MKGAMFKRSVRKTNPREKRSSPVKVLFQDPVGHVLPPSLSNFRWNVDKVERKLQEKIQEKTQIAGNFVYQQAYRLLECTRGEGIDFVSFREQLRIKFGIILEEGELQLLFDKYDEDRNGTIDLNEFIRHVLPPDYNYGRQWFEQSQQVSEEKQTALKRASRHEFLMGMGFVRDDLDDTGEGSHWTLETLLKQIQTKVVQRTPGGDDQYRRAFKMLRAGRDQGIRMRELRNNLKTKFGIFVSESQMTELFSRFDKDGSGEIDLKEFLQFVEPPAYPSNSKVPMGLWTEDDDEGREETVEDRHAGPLADETEAEGMTTITTAHCCEHHHHHHHYHGASGPSTSTKNVIKKERPMSANPKKQAMLKQRREQQTASTTQLLERHLCDTETHGLYGHSSGGHLSATKASQTRRLSMSMVDLHQDHQTTLRPMTAGAAHHHHHHHCCTVSDKKVTGHHDGLRYEYEDENDGGSSVRSGASSVSILRPRSAGSIAGSALSHSSSSTSVRGAAYMRRPSTPQHLRQKCLESRLGGGSVAMPAVSSDAKLKKRVTMGHTPTTINTTNNGVAKRAPGQGQNQGKTRHQSVSDDHGEEYGRTTDDQYEAPRVTRVHPKQHDPRPYSQGGRVLMRSKVSSAGCR